MENAELSKERIQKKKSVEVELFLINWQGIIQLFGHGLEENSVNPIIGIDFRTIPI